MAIEKTSEKAHKRVEEASQKFLISYSKLTPTIDFAYPTQRLYYNAVEGKPSVRAPGSTALEFPNPAGRP